MIGAEAMPGAPRIVVLDRETLPDEIILRSPRFAHSWESFPRTRADEVADRIAGATIVITNKVPVRREAIERSPSLKLVAVAATGTDIVDVAACAEHGVTVCNVRNYAANTVPEHTFALMLALRRSILPYHASVRGGRWGESGQFCYFDYPIRDLAGSTLGIIGAGVLGSAVAEISKAFGMTVLLAARKGASSAGPGYTPFEEVLRRSDVLTLHLPLKPSTRDLIARPEFKLMERRPLLINTARGGLVNEADLVEALETGLISGAGFDVATAEPPAPNHPFFRLLDRPDFILTPHVAWASREAIQGLADQLIDNVEAFWRGRPVNVVLPPT